MTDYAERQARIRKEARKRRRKARLEDVLVWLLVAVGGLGALLGLVLVLSLIGAVGVYIGWNLGVFNLAHAVHASVGHIGFLTSFGASFAIGVLGRIFRPDAVKVERKA